MISQGNNICSVFYIYTYTYAFMYTSCTVAEQYNLYVFKPYMRNPVSWRKPRFISTTPFNDITPYYIFITIHPHASGFAGLHNHPYIIHASGFACLYYIFTIIHLSLIRLFRPILYISISFLFLFGPSYRGRYAPQSVVWTKNFITNRICGSDYKSHNQEQSSD